MSSETKSTSSLIEKAEAPWTAEQVAQLNKRQADPTRHPYTCGTKDKHVRTIPGKLTEQETILVATTEGWKCPGCNYTQNWAHLADTRSEEVNYTMFTAAMAKQHPELVKKLPHLFPDE